MTPMQNALAIPTKTEILTLYVRCLVGRVRF